MSNKPKLWDICKITDQNSSKEYGHESQERTKELAQIGRDSGNMTSNAIWDLMLNPGREKRTLMGKLMTF